MVLEWEDGRFEKTAEFGRILPAFSTALYRCVLVVSPVGHVECARPTVECSGPVIQILVTEDITTPTTNITICPQPDKLRQLVSGSLAETDAAIVFVHIDQCTVCQQMLDELSRDHDDIIAKTRKAAAKRPVGKLLPRLIKDAQSLAKPEEPRQRSVGQLPVDTFVAGLRHCGLFDDSQVDALISDVAAVDSSSIAKELVSRQKLTPFQARALLKGRWKGLVLGNYEILEKLGQGGMGSVFKARHRRLGRIVCVKVMNQAGRKSATMMERFRNEARTIASLSHPNFIVAHDADEAEGVPFLVMEFIEGEDLAKHVHVHGPLKLRTALNVIQQIADAMQYAHDSRVTHRDIKPHNIMLTDEGDGSQPSVKILDLGLARFDSVLNEDPDASLRAAMTNTGVIMGTVDYMSPEQALRSRDADNRSDIYSLGCTLHYLLTGLPVFDGDTVMARLVAHREQVVPSLERQCVGAMPHLDDVFFRMLAKQPADRYQSMNDVSSDIAALLTDRVPQATAGASTGSGESVLTLMRSRRRQQNYGRWAMIGLLFCVACLGVWAVNSWDREGSPAVPMTQSQQKTSVVSSSVLPQTSNSVFDSIATAPRFNFASAGSITNGGNGVALVILPFENVNLQHLVAWQLALQEQNIDVMYASSEDGHPISRTDFDLPHVRAISAVDEYLDDIDMILFAGGPTEGFNRDVEVKERLSSILRAAMPRGVVLGRFSGAQYDALDSVFDRIQNSGVETSPQPYDVKIRNNNIRAEEVRVTRPFGFEGAFMEINPPQGDTNAQLIQATKLVSLAVKRRQEFHSRNDSFDRLAFYDKFNPAHLRRNWGRGRALVVLPFVDYNANELHWVQKVLQQQEGVELLYTSSEWGSPKDEHGRSGVDVQVLLDRFSARHFDYIVFVSGDSSGFQEEQNPDVFRQLNSVVQTALDEGIIMAAVSSQATELLKLVDVESYLLQQSSGPVRFGTPAGKPSGCVVAVDKPQELTKLHAQMQVLRNRLLGRADEAM